MKKIVLKSLLITIFLVSIFFVWQTKAEAAMVGEEVLFFVDSSYDALGRSTLRATLVQVGERAYYYVETDWWNSLVSPNLAKLAIQDLQTEFDSNIYPKLTYAYGPIWEPGIDKDNKITILISRIKEGAGGYFNAADEYPKKMAENSNEREMIYLNTSYINSSRAMGFLAHEFQHMISFNNKERLHGVSDDIWLNEARSEYASTLLGYDNLITGSNLEKRIYDFFKNPSDSLTEWTNATVDYGVVNLFMQYLVSHYGEKILALMTQSSEVGIGSIDLALNKTGAGVNFADVFSNWTITNFLNDCKINKDFCYFSPNLNRVQTLPTLIQTLPTLSSSTVSLSGSIKDWAGSWYQFVNNNGTLRNLKIDFQGNDFSLPLIIKKIDGTVEVKFITLDVNDKGTGFIKDFSSQIKSVILIPISQVKRNNFGTTEPDRPFFYQVSLTNEEIEVPPTSTPVVMKPNYPDGSLLRAKGDYKVYIINNGFKRWILSAEIFKFYGHLGFAKVIEVTPEELAWYQDSWLVRAQGDTKVYEINADGSKHWLNITARQFSDSGRKWESVFIINYTERDFYKIGAAVIK